MKMYTSRILFFLFLITSTISLSAQNFIAGTQADAAYEALKSMSRFQKRMPAGYDGIAIEITRSEYPMHGTEPVFKKFGNMYYDKLREGGYSYVIQTNFSDYESASRFCENVVRPKAPAARVITYKKGIRFIK